MQSTLLSGLLPEHAAEPAPPLQVSQWFNTPEPLSLSGLRGRVIALHAFQMLCPGCVSHALPQALAAQAAFAEAGLITLGLHSVFEHHEAMRPAALAAFLHEYRIDFPVAVDAPLDDGPAPATLRRYGLRGTPSLVLIDRAGRRRLQHFGRIPDLQLGAWFGQLLAEPELGESKTRVASVQDGLKPEACSSEGCALPGIR